MTFDEWFQRFGLDNKELKTMAQLAWEAGRKEWIGLTTEEKYAVRDSVEYSQFMSAEEYASLVQYETEAKLKEKNHG